MEMSLLEELAGQLGCMYLSDLHRAKPWWVGRCLRNLHAETYSLWEWNDAAQYLTGMEIRFSSQEAAKEFLLDALSGQTE